MSDEVTCFRAQNFRVLAQKNSGNGLYSPEWFYSRALNRFNFGNCSKTLFVPYSGTLIVPYRRVLKNVSQIIQEVLLPLSANHRAPIMCPRIQAYIVGFRMDFVWDPESHFSKCSFYSFKICNVINRMVSYIMIGLACF